MAASVLAWILAWVLFAFGGTYAWALLPALAGIAALAAMHRPPVARDEWRALDLALLCLLILAALQLVPLPLALRNAISPGAADFDQRVALSGVPRSSWAPLSLAPGAWLRGAGCLAGAVICFWIARDAARGRGARRLARAIAWMGLVAGIVTVIQPAFYNTRGIYGFWKLNVPHANPGGPLISRNHMATWLILAWPLTAGYLIAHLRSHWPDRKRRIELVADGRAIWLAASGIVMAAALVVTQSRAGLIGFASALAFGFARAWRRVGVAGRAGIVTYAMLLVVAAAVWARPDRVFERFDEAAGANAWGGRPAIWRESLDLTRRFWTAGVGVGAFDMVMAVYQTGGRHVLINHAHNEYLNRAAEGGLLLGVPTVIAVFLFMRLAARRLAHDRSPMSHVREGAMAGLFGFLVQSIWETPTLTPAVFFMLAASAGLAVHASSPDHVPHEARG